MLTLAIDTASSTTGVAILDGGKVLAEKSWISEQNEAEKLLPEIIRLVPDLRRVGKIIAVSGPGSFTGLRVGVAAANTLAYLLGASLYGVDTFTIWKKRYTGKNAVLLIKAGRNEIFADGKLTPAEKIKAKKAYGDLLPAQKEMLKEKGIEFVPDSEIKSFGRAAVSLPPGKLKKVDLIKPDYRRGPQITISKDKWKKPRNPK